MTSTQTDLNGRFSSRGEAFEALLRPVFGDHIIEFDTARLSTRLIGQYGDNSWGLVPPAAGTWLSAIDGTRQFPCAHSVGWVEPEWPTDNPNTATIRAIVNGGVADQHGQLVAELAQVVGERDSLADQLGLMQQSRDDLQAQLRTLDAELNRQRDRATTLNRSLISFKEQVVEAASEAADEHGWCGEIDTILQGLGLERQPNKFKSVVVIRVEITAKRSSGRGVPEDDWVAGCLNTSNLRECIRNGFSMDSDVQDERITDIEIEVEDTEEDND